MTDHSSYFVTMYKRSKLTGGKRLKMKVKRKENKIKIKIKIKGKGAKQRKN